MSSITQMSAPAAPENVSTTSHVMAEEESVSWRHCAIVDEWRTVIMPVAVALLLLLAIGFGTKNIGNVFFAAAVLLVVSWHVWMPMRFAADSHGLVKSCLGRARRVNWASVARLQTLPRGIRLLGNSEPDPFDAWTGLYVPCGAHREEVMKLAAQHVRTVEPLA